MSELMRNLKKLKEHHKVIFENWRQKVRVFKRQTYTLYLAYKDPRVPWYAKLLAALVIGYAFSPIDLIPDFIPILGYVDDLILVPLGIKMVIKLIPKEVLAEYQEKAEAELNGKLKNWYAAAVIMLIWTLAFIWLASTVWHNFHS